MILLESNEMATPATIRWRTPTVLLPPDWRTWDDVERRVALAHELAHVRRSDYLIGLLSQMSLALHYANPLAHGLAAWLRLQQELAADAMASACVGGNRPYLSTLARLALAQSDPVGGRDIPWPARPLFSTRGILLKRIAMLRSTDPGRLGITFPTRGTRVITVMLLATAGFVVAGLGGPEAPSTVVAQEKDEAKAAPAQRSFDLSYVPRETSLLVALKPAELLSRPEFEPITRMLRENAKPAPGGFPAPPDEIEQWLMVNLPEESAPAAQPRRRPRARVGMIVRTTKAQDWKTAAQGYIPTTEEAAIEGHVLYRSKDEPFYPALLAIDNRTALIAQKDLLEIMIEHGPNPGVAPALDAAWSRVKSGPFLIAGNADGLHALIPAMGLTTLEDSAFSPLWEKGRTFALAIQTGDNLKLEAVATCSSADDACSVADTCQAALTLARNTMRNLGRQAESKPQVAMPRVFLLSKLIGPLLDAAKIEVQDKANPITVRLESAPEGLWTAELINVLMPAVQASRAAAQRVQSVNNMKQIGLAFHFYLAANGHFPPAVLLGPDGKTPHSWRVAILPYIEQVELYKQYHFDEPWDGPHNRELLAKIPPLYHAPNAEGDPTFASYFAPTGPDTIFAPGGKGTKINEISDGTVNTILAVEGRREIPWTKPEDIPIPPQSDRSTPMPEFGGYSPDGFNVLFADGSVRFVKNSINPQTLRAMFSRAGREVIQIP